MFVLVDANREYLANWLPWVPHTTQPEDVQHFIEQCRAQFDVGGGFNGCIRLGGEIAGCIGSHGVDPLDRSTSLGYWLAEAHTGQGIMTRCCRALVEHGFSGLGLHRVEIRCAVGNTASRAVPERLGFEREGVLREAQWLAGKPHDLVVYGQLAHAWQVSPGRMG